jgi:hypothetical protein
MRSELVFGAMTYISNRYLIARLAAKASRKLHRPHTRIQDTTNIALERFARFDPTADTQHATPLQLSIPHDTQYDELFVL